MTDDSGTSDHGARSDGGAMILRYQEAVEKNARVEIGVGDLDKIIGSISLLAFSIDVLADAIKNRIRVSDESEILLDLAAQRAADISSLMTDLSLEIMKRADHG